MQFENILNLDNGETNFLFHLKIIPEQVGLVYFELNCEILPELIDYIFYI